MNFWTCIANLRPLSLSYWIIVIRYTRVYRFISLCHPDKPNQSREEGSAGGRTRSQALIQAGLREQGMSTTLFDNLYRLSSVSLTCGMTRRWVLYMSQGCVSQMISTFQYGIPAHQASSYLLPTSLRAPTRNLAQQGPVFKVWDDTNASSFWHSV